MDLRDPRSLLPCVVAALGVGLLGFNALPVAVGALVDGAGLDEGRAGWIASLELAGMALSALVLAPRIPALSLRSVALGSAGVALAAHGVSVLADGFAPLASARFVAGLAEGAIVATGNALIASSRDPDRFAARVEILGGIAAAALLVALPAVAAAHAQRGVFTVMAGVVIAILPLLAWIPRRASAPHRAAAGGLRGRLGRRALPVLLAGFLLTSGESAIWAFLERIGVRAGVGPTSMGLLLGTSTLVGLLGAGLAAWLGTRLGRRLPFVLGIVAQALACWFVAHSTTPGPYVAATLGYALAFFFVQPYLVGTAAFLDPQGRVVAAYAGVVLIGAGVGPGLGGVLVEWHSYPALGWQLLVASAGAVAAILPLAATLDREARAGG
jgi:predicted MFS family arabinose efflux permease